LALGCILAIIEYKGILERMNNKIFLLAIVLGIVFVGVSSTFGHFYINLFKHNAYGILYFGIIGYCLTTDSSKFFNVFLTSAPMQYLGKISYGLYIWHILAMLLLEHYMKSINLTVDFSIMVVLTIILSTASYYVLELKFLTLKKYFK
jgi:peptidoglycan/LPS O-acetylase OafA/YrhL